MEKNQSLEEFKKFGKKMEIVMILTIIGIITMGFIQVVIAIVLLLSLQHIKNINQDLNDKNLRTFRLRILGFALMDIVGYLVSIIFMIILMLLFMNNLPFPNPPTEQTIFLFTILFRFLITTLIIVFGLGFVRNFLGMTSWKNLNIFFSKIFDIFPSDIAEKAKGGADKLRRSYLFVLLVGLFGILPVIFLLFFPQFIAIGSLGFLFFITILIFLVIVPGFTAGILGIVSFILMILGYSDLSNLNRL